MTQFTFVQKSLGLLWGGIIAWFSIAVFTVLLPWIINIVSGSAAGFPIGTTLAIYALFGIPIALAFCFIFGHILWFIGDKVGMSTQKGAALLGIFAALPLTLFFTAQAMAGSFDSIGFITPFLFLFVGAITGHFVFRTAFRLQQKSQQ